MDLSQYLNMMRDPAGLPFYPIIFQLLMVLTFAMHIVMVNLVVGGVVLAIWEKAKNTPFSHRLTKALARMITVSLSIAIVLGVAPLLFVQTIYDPFWYTATTMSAVWAMFFLVAVAGAFYAAYTFYLGKLGAGNPKTTFALSSYVCVIFLALAGVIIHMITMEQTIPNQWKEWTVSPWTGMNTTGFIFHGIKLGRLMHFILPSFAVTGVFLMIYSWYFQPRSDYPQEYLNYVAEKGAKMALWFSVFSVGAGFWWAGMIPKDLHFLSNPFFIVGAVAGLILMVFLAKAAMEPVKNAIPAAVAMFVVIFLMCYAREALRMAYAGAFGYSIFDYKLNISWGSTLLFFATFIGSFPVLYFTGLAAFKAGRAEKGQVVTISPSAGKLALSLMVVWFVVVAGFGVVISLKNGTLF